jgi:hypothetical protein
MMKAVFWFESRFLVVIGSPALSDLTVTCCMAFEVIEVGRGGGGVVFPRTKSDQLPELDLKIFRRDGLWLPFFSGDGILRSGADCLEWDWIEVGPRAENVVRFVG